ncbi:hypothetical protein ES705_06398 [subsurface metagenome]
MLNTQIEARLKKVTRDNNIKSWLDFNLPHYRSHFNPSIYILLGISQKTWYNYLNCSTQIPHTILAKLVIILEPWGCTYDDLIKIDHG